jgi:nicotinate-nucleotide pyrophosphorylase (carboxylating)
MSTYLTSLKYSEPEYSKPEEPSQVANCSEGDSLYTRESLKPLLSTYLIEDLGLLNTEGDITSSAIIPDNLISTATLYAKEDTVLAGLEIFQAVYEILDPNCSFHSQYKDGQYISKVEIATNPQAVATISANARALLCAERLSLNILQRLCGIATTTYQYVKLAKPFGIAIKDTRKTTPGLRYFEKYAVRVGGGTNHRYGLYDQILIKDNHIAIAGGISQAIVLARKANPSAYVEVEVCTLGQYMEALDNKVEAILLDNMKPDLIRRCLEAGKGYSHIELSGGINTQNISSYLINGVDSISIGALTHSVKSIDLSLEVEL